MKIVVLLIPTVDSVLDSSELKENENTLKMSIWNSMHIIEQRMHWNGKFRTEYE